MIVLILGDDGDEHALHVLNGAGTRGLDAALVDTREFPGATTIILDPAGGGGLRLPTGREILFSAISSVYWRAYHGASTPDLPDPEQAFIAWNDARGLLESLLVSVPARWVNGWEGYSLHQKKPAALARIAALGVPIPKTLVTNDAHAVQAFARAHPSVIFKPVQGGAHARPLTPAHLTPVSLARLAIAPVTIQEEVFGTNVRVFVIGKRVLACTIETTCLDFRDDPDPRIEPHALSEAMQTQCLRIASALHLVFTGIDFRLTPEGAYVFLEANPSPMFLGFEDATGLPLTEELLDFLTV